MFGCRFSVRTFTKHCQEPRFHRSTLPETVAITPQGPNPILPQGLWTASVSSSLNFECFSVGSQRAHQGVLQECRSSVPQLAEVSALSRTTSPAALIWRSQAPGALQSFCSYVVLTRSLHPPTYTARRACQGENMATAQPFSIGEDGMRDFL